MRLLFTLLVCLGLALPMTTLAADEADKPKTEQGEETSGETDEEPECD